MGPGTLGWGYRVGSWGGTIGWDHEVGKKEFLKLVFSYEFCEIFKNSFFTEHLWVTASVLCHLMNDSKHD